MALACQYKKHTARYTPNASLLRSGRGGVTLPLFGLGDVVVTLESLLIPILLALVWMFWMVQQRARSLALKHVRKACQQEWVQLLDDTLVLESIRPSRNAAGRFCLERRYGFEFSSTGERRYKGEVHLRGQRVAHLELEPHQVGPGY